MMRDERNASNQVSGHQVELASLTRRLQDGEVRIQSAIARGEDVTAWEDFWLRLLHEYESLHDRITSGSGDAIEGHQRIAA